MNAKPMPLHHQLRERLQNRILRGEWAPGTPMATEHELAAEYGIPVTQVTNWLAAARRDFRSAVLDTLRDLSGSDAEFRADALSLLGIEP